jgi:phosphoribosylformylglycinamidine synthase
VANIAGVFNETKTVLGLMPHPERAVDPLLTAGVDGKPLFDALIKALG